MHKVISFESEICQHLGWLYAPGGAEGDAGRLRPARARFPADVLTWVQSTQPKAWETLTKNQGAKAEDTLLARLRVVRQVRYSQHNENNIDLVLFLNGLPVATVKLKTDFTQSIGDAIAPPALTATRAPRGKRLSRC